MEQNSNVPSQTNKTMPHSSPLYPDLGKELPFLITHYLSNFGYNAVTDGDEEAIKTKNKLLAQIQNLGDELSDAFHKLGSFGTTTNHVSKSDLLSCHEVYNL